jgi:sugar (pentulose or hexulose) kinase
MGEYQSASCCTSPAGFDTVLAAIGAGMCHNDGRGTVAGTIPAVEPPTDEPLLTGVPELTVSAAGGVVPGASTRVLRSGRQ